jgi:hypothetical protein
MSRASLSLVPKDGLVSRGSSPRPLGHTFTVLFTAGSFYNAGFYSEVEGVVAQCQALADEPSCCQI